MNFSGRHIAFTYHSIHRRQFSDLIDSKLFRNSTPEATLQNQLSTLKRLSSNSDGNRTLLCKRFLSEEFSILITFDDGFRNNLRAAELFYEVFGTAPLIVFLTTNLVGSNRTIWPVELALLILRGQFSSKRLEFEDEFFDIGRPEKRLETFDSIRQRFKRMNALSRGLAFEAIREQAWPGELERLGHEYKEFQMLNLDEIKQMQSMGVRFQPHGHNHEILHENQDAQIIRREIVESMAFIKDRLNEKCDYFSYPNGNYCEAAISALKESGFMGAYSTDVGVATALENNFKIPRLTPSSKPRKFRRQLRGKLD